MRRVDPQRLAGLDVRHEVAELPQLPLPADRAANFDERYATARQHRQRAEWKPHDRIPHDLGDVGDDRHGPRSASQ